jgi:YD repeat-containing protein
LRGIVLEINIAGQKFTYNYPALPNLTHTFTWDGKDAYGRPIQGKVDGLVRIGYQYRLIYGSDPAPFGRKNFAGYPSAAMSVTGTPGRQATTLWTSWNVKLGAIDARGQGLGGWSLDTHHVYNPIAKTVYKGDGSRVGGTNTNSVIKIVAGNNPLTTPYFGEGVPATSVRHYSVGGMAIGKDNALYFTQYGGKNTNGHIRRISPDGIITTIAGEYTVGGGFAGDGGPAANARLYFPTDVALDKQGNLYITDSYNHRVRKVSPDGMINTVAGFGASGPSVPGLSGDGGPATGAKMNTPWSVAVLPDGSLAVMEYGNHILRIINQAGVINTIAGMGTILSDGSPAYTAGVTANGYVTGLPNGDLYIWLGYNYIARITNALPGFTALDYAIPSEDGSTLWMFDRNGKHIQTKNTLTGAVINTFGYDTAGKLITVTDGDGNVTRFTYSADGLMTSMTDPNNGAYTFTHDAMGKLTADHNPVGGGWTLTSSKTKTTQASSITSAEGRVDTTLREILPTGGERMTLTSPSGATSEILTKLDGTTVSPGADGTEPGAQLICQASMKSSLE